MLSILADIFSAFLTIFKHGKNKILSTNSTPSRTFVNTAAISCNKEFFMIDFGARAKSTEEPTILHCIMLSAHVAKLIMIGLSNAIEEHEKKFGEIKAPSQEQVRLAARYAEKIREIHTLKPEDLN